MRDIYNKEIKLVKEKINGEKVRIWMYETSNERKTN